MHVFSVSWSHHRAVVFGYNRGSIYQTYLDFTTPHRSIWWRSRMSIGRLSGQKLGLIPSSEQIVLSSKPTYPSKWFHVKPILPVWLPPALYQWLCPLQMLRDGLYWSKQLPSSPWVVGLAGTHVRVYESEGVITQVDQTHEATMLTHDVVLYYQSLGGICHLGVGS